MSTICTCHASLRNTKCLVAFDLSSSSSQNLEIPQTELEKLLTEDISCALCRTQALQLIKTLELHPGLSIPIESTWSLSSIGNHRFTAKPLTSTATAPPPPTTSVSDIFNFISQRSGGGIKFDVPCEETNAPEEDYARFKYNVYLHCQNSTKSRESLLGFAQQLDFMFESIAVGYSFLRVYYPESMETDLVWLLNNMRHDQADFFHSCADVLRFAPDTKLAPRFQDFFFKSLQVFEHRQAWEALRYGMHLTDPNKLASLVYRDLQPIYPFAMFIDFFLRIQVEYEDASRMLALTSLQLVEKFTTADRWENLQQDGDLLLPFCPLFSSKRTAEDLALFIKAADQQQQRSNMVSTKHTSCWFGVAQINKEVLEEIARHFFQNRVSEYRKSTHDLLRKFLYKMNDDGGGGKNGALDVFSMVKNTVDAMYSIKIGTLAYGDLDWLLFHLQHNRYCTLADGQQQQHVAFSHVVGRHLNSQQQQQQQAVATTTPPPPPQQYRPFSSLLEDIEQPPSSGATNKSSSTVTMVTSSPQVVEEWSSTRPNVCVVRLPASYFDYVTHGGALIADTCRKANGAVTIEVIRSGKILVAPSAFRVQSKTKEQTQFAVKLFKEAVLNLGLCESRFKITKRAYPQIVGKNGERIASIRDRSMCRVYLSECVPPSEEWNLVCLFGLPEQVVQAAQMVRRFANDEALLAKQQPSPPPPAASAAARTQVAATLFAQKKRQNGRNGEASPPSPPEDRVHNSAGKKNTDDLLFKAVQRRDWPLAETLLEREAGIFFVAASGTTVLHKAAERNAPESIVQSLVDRGLDVNQSVMDNGYSALHFAIKSNARASIVAILISAGADVNARCEGGCTPTHLVVKRNGQVRLLHLLIKAGAQLDLVDDEFGQTPLEMARQGNASQEIIQLLERAVTT